MTWPCSTDRLILVVKDSDDDVIRVKSDDVLGSIYLSIKELVSKFSKPGGGLRWLNIYGAPLSTIYTETKIEMNANPELASLWKGRILANFEISDSKSPEAAIRRVDPEFASSALVQEALRLKQYEIIAEVANGISLPDSQKYRIKIQVGADAKDVDYCMTTKPAVEVLHKFNKWVHRFDRKIVKTPYQSLDEMDRIYVYLLDESDTPVCFWKGRIKDFTDRNPRHKWYALTNDEFYGKVEYAYQAGQIQFKLSINNLEQNPAVKWE